jgi:GTP-binding protein
MLTIKNVGFVKSAASLDGLYDGGVLQIAVAGKSNAGKSSFINFLANDKNMARVAKDAGRTRLINYFDFDGQFLLVDLPGYGFAQAPKEEKERWARLVDGYFKSEKKLSHVFLLIDLRNGVGAGDLVLIDFMFKRALPFTIIATKTDKIPRSRINQKITMLAAELKIGRDDIIPISSLKKTGKERVLETIEKVLNTNGN